MSDLILSANNQQVALDAKVLEQTGSSASAAALTADQKALNKLLASLSIGQQLSARIIVKAEQVILEIANAKIALAQTANEQIRAYQDKQVILEVRSKANPTELKLINIQSQPTKSLPAKSNSGANQVSNSQTTSNQQSAAQVASKPTVNNNSGNQAVIKQSVANQPAAKSIDKLLAALKTVSQPQSLGNQSILTKATDKALGNSIKTTPLTTSNKSQANNSLHQTSLKGAHASAKQSTKQSTIDNHELTIKPSSHKVSAKPQQQPIISDIKISNSPKDSSSRAASTSTKGTEQTESVNKTAVNKVSISSKQASKSASNSIGTKSDASSSIQSNRSTAKPVNIVNARVESTNKDSATGSVIGTQVTAEVKPKGKVAASLNIKASTDKAANTTAVTNPSTTNRSTTSRKQSVASAEPVSKKSSTDPSNKAPEQVNLKVKVALADRQQFPEIAQALSQAYHQVAKAPRLDQSLNKLFDQLLRLNNWNKDITLSKHSKLGAEVTEQAKKLNEATKDLFRYIQKTTSPSRQQVERHLKQSGSLYEKKTLTKQQPKQALNLHKDLKANLVRVQNTSLYVLAKLATLIKVSTGTNSNLQQTLTQAAQTAAQASAQLTNPSSAQATAQASTSASATNPTSAQPVPLAQAQLDAAERALKKGSLINQVKQRLSGLVSKGVSVEQLQQLEQIAKTMLTQSKAALSRTQLVQLANIKTEAMTGQWLFDLPVQTEQGIDLFQIYLEQKSKKQQKSKSQWTLSVQFDIPPLGKVIGKLQLNQDRYDIHFYAQEQRTLELIENELSVFKEQLASADIKFEQISVTKRQIDELAVEL